MSEQDTREHMDNGVSVQMCPNDSREKLEADVRDGWLDDFSRGKVLELLDRQAAITERELCVDCDWPLVAVQPDEEAYDRIAELTAERDQLSRDLTAEHALLLQFEDDNERLREAVNAFDLNQFYSLYRAKCEECEEAVSFAKRLENEVNSRKPVTLFGVDYFTAEGMCEECANMYLHETKALDKQNKKLLAEHERLLKKLKRLRRRLAKAKKERDYLQRVVKAQADSFKKLEIELAGKDG